MSDGTAAFPAFSETAITFRITCAAKRQPENCKAVFIARELQNFVRDILPAVIRSKDTQRARIV